MEKLTMGQRVQLKGKHTFSGKPTLQDKRDKLKSLQLAEAIGRKIAAKQRIVNRKILLNDVRSELREMKQSVIKLKSINSKLRTTKQNKKLTYLENLIPKVEIKLRLDSVKLKSKFIPKKLAKIKCRTVDGVKTWSVPANYSKDLCQNITGSIKANFDMTDKANSIVEGKIGKSRVTMVA